MEFDIKRVYTSVNADEVKVGSKIICASTMKALMSMVESNDITELKNVLPDCYTNRFQAHFNEDLINYNLCYLVSEPEEKKLKWTDLKIGDVIRSKKLPFIKHLITGIDEGAGKVFFCSSWKKGDELAEWEKVEE